MPDSNPLASAEPIKVDSIDEEYQYIATLTCSRCGGHYTVTGQSLLLPPDRPPMDIIEIICVQCSQSNSVSFDISTFYGK